MRKRRGGGAEPLAVDPSDPTSSDAYRTRKVCRYVSIRFGVASVNDRPLVMRAHVPRQVELSVRMSNLLRIMWSA
jgi:hypothetical protein